MREIFKPEDKLPNDGEYVLIRLSREKPWLSNDDNVFWTVAMFNKGISLEDREKLDHSDERKTLYKGCDEQGNNMCWYNWSEFGPSTHFGQEVVCWCYLPNLNENEFDLNKSRFSN